MTRLNPTEKTYPLFQCALFDIYAERTGVVTHYMNWGRDLVSKIRRSTVQRHDLHRDSQ